jgi:hypothetical protein
LSEGTNAVEERAIYRLLQYPWADLSNGQQSFTFTSDGAYSRWYLLVSVSAAGEEDSLEFVLDGVVLDWSSRGFDDREFYDWVGTQGFTPGNYKNTFYFQKATILLTNCPSITHTTPYRNGTYFDQNFVTKLYWCSRYMCRICAILPLHIMYW